MKLSSVFEDWEEAISEANHKQELKKKPSMYKEDGTLSVYGIARLYSAYHEGVPS